MKMSEPKAVLISDIHYTVATLQLANTALNTALKHAENLKVPLIIAGDLLDQKSIIRGECANALINIFKKVKVPVYLLVGNHDLLNERSKEHSLNFLSTLVNLIDTPQYLVDLNIWCIPYQSDLNELRDIISSIPKQSTIVMHQGLNTADMGHYIQDKSALSKEDIADYRVISGHYHKSQNIKCGRARKGAVGLFSYIGNPYTLSNSEALDPPKGYKILYDDGILLSVPLNLRTHVKAKMHVDNPNYLLGKTKIHDIITIVLQGPSEKLYLVDKKEFGLKILGHTNYKLELSPDKLTLKQSLKSTKLQSPQSILDSLIDASSESPENKKLLKKEWKDILQCDLKNAP